jgi:hypothetical protein
MEAERLGFKSQSWIEFLSDERNFIEMKDGIPLIHLVPDKEKLEMEKFKREVEESSQSNPYSGEPIIKPTSVLLIFPYSLKDKRWIRMGIPPSLLFLSSSLKSNSHSVKIKKIPIESEIILEEIENFSWIGIPLYD